MNASQRVAASITVAAAVLTPIVTVVVKLASAGWSTLFPGIILLVLLAIGTLVTLAVSVTVLVITCLPRMRVAGVARQTVALVLAGLALVLAAFFVVDRGDVGEFSVFTRLVAPGQLDAAPADLLAISRPLAIVSIIVAIVLWAWFFIEAGFGIARAISGRARERREERTAQTVSTIPGAPTGRAAVVDATPLISEPAQVTPAAPAPDAPSPAASTGASAEPKPYVPGHGPYGTDRDTDEPSGA